MKLGLWDKIKSEWESFTKQERKFLFFAMLCSFFISADYAIIRPVSNSLFIHSFGAHSFPYAWLFSIPFNFLIVALYNRYLPTWGCLKLFLFSASTITMGNCLAATYMGYHSSLPFLFYLWKDVYVMLMFQLLWSVIHATIDSKKAKYLYGLLFGVGAIGGLCGSLIPGFLAVKMGSETLLYSTFPLYALLCGAYYFLMKNSANVETKVDEEVNKRSSLKESFGLIASSKLLTAIMLMVIFMQVTATITDFQFNTLLEKLYPNKDVRTEYFGKLLSLGNIFTMSFQFIGIFVLIQYLGRFRTHFLVPIILCMNGVLFITIPVFGVISYLFLTIKCFDFSLFNVIKEMLYIPLKTEEKFRAKAMIDVFVYRGSKVFASFCILALQFFYSSSLISLLSWVNVGIFLVWCFVVKAVKEHYEPSISLPQAQS